MNYHCRLSMLCHSLSVFYWANVIQILVESVLLLLVICKCFIVRVGKRIIVNLYLTCFTYMILLLLLLAKKLLIFHRSKWVKLFSKNVITIRSVFTKGDFWACSIHLVLSQKYPTYPYDSFVCSSILYHFEVAVRFFLLFYKMQIRCLTWGCETSYLHFGENVSSHPHTYIHIVCRQLKQQL